MKQSATLLICLLLFQLKSNSQTTHVITMPSSGSNTIDVTCVVGDIIQFQSSGTPLAIKIFRNPTPDFTVTVTGNSTSYIVTATDTSYSSIISLSPVSTCRGKIILSPATTIIESAIDQHILIYPNPATGFLNFTNITDGSKVEVLDVTGKVCKKFIVTSNISEFDISYLQKGIYFLRTEKCVSKFIKN